MFNRYRGSEAVVHDNEQTNLNNQRIAFCGYLLSLLLWSFILPAPVFFSLCGITVVGCIAVTVFPELGELLGKTGDLISDTWSELVSGRQHTSREAHPPTHAVRIDPSLIQRRLNITNPNWQNRTIENNDLDVVLWHEPLFRVLEGVHPPRSRASFQRMEKSRQRLC